MGGLVDNAAGLLSRRLVVTTWIPLFVLLSALIGLAAAGTGWATLTTAWDEIPADLRVLAGLVLLAATTMLAHLLNAVRPQLVRLYEGYWPEPIARRYLEHQLRVHADLKRRAADPWPVTHPRHAPRVRPTRLGNILRAAEEHPLRQYGLPAALAWPRLHGVLPDAFLKTFGSVAADLELMITISFLGLVLAVSGAPLAVVLLPWYAAPLVLLAGAAVFWFGYRAAVRAAVPYANQVRAAFDVHRWKLLEAMGLRLPTGYEEERAQWQQLRKLWGGAGPDTDREQFLRYPVDEPPATLTLLSQPAASTDPAAQQPLVPPPAPPAPAPPAPAPVGAPPVPAERVPELRRDARLVLAVALVATLASTCIRAGLQDEPTRTGRQVSAFHQLTARDLDRADKDLQDRYTLVALQSGERVDADALGPRLPPGALSGQVIVTVKVSPGAGSMVRGGDRVTVRWTSGRSSTPRKVTGVLVLRLLDGDRAVLAAAPAAVDELPASGTVQLTRP